ncbi:helix-turn-helix transcriptional regulator [Anoxynatronum buryatiense]|uniref:helix-turn-helix transcriptional regulator n=1 Tax=Anoxynatronum buryatiense TaxID=489973 RepID=UPI0024B6555A|nr:helix-turn-helix transcriptional regulator [Anoxynatronum buryatiense]
MTQKELARKIGVSQQVISRFENEKHVPKLDNFLKILNGLDLEISIRKKQYCENPLGNNHL